MYLEIVCFLSKCFERKHMGKNLTKMCMVVANNFVLIACISELSSCISIGLMNVHHIAQVLPSQCAYSTHQETIIVRHKP